MKFIVKIYKEPWNEGISLMFAVEHEDGRLSIVKPMQMELAPYKEGESARPSLQLAHYQAPQFLKALSEALDREGIKTENDFKVNGLLEATKYHLEDMRKLLKLK